MPPDLLLRSREELKPMKDGCHKRSNSKDLKKNGRGSWSSASQYSDKKPVEPVQRLAALLRHRRCKDIIVMAGAGISTASGIPDFRSPGTGLYYNTKKYNVSNPQDVFDLQYFNKNPHPFLDIIRDFMKSERFPNVIHSFCKMLESRGLLLRMYTQNIDGLEKKSGISSARLVEAHGTLGSASCCKCFQAHSASWTEKVILDGKIPSCKKKSCSGYVKPDVVMFGEELPKKFYLYPKDFERCDLLIIMGTSLNVEPFSELADAVPKRVPRVLLNRDAVGPFVGRRRKNDIFIPGDIAKSISKVLKIVGWSSEVVSENGSSSDLSTSDVEEHTWASSRLIKQTYPVSRDIETLSMPNSVIRKKSECNIVNKMSVLSVSDEMKSRRSVSAPLPKSEMKQLESTDAENTNSENNSSEDTKSDLKNSDENNSNNIAPPLVPQIGAETTSPEVSISVQPTSVEHISPSSSLILPIMEQRTSAAVTTVSSVKTTPRSLSNSSPVAAAASEDCSDVNRALKSEENSLAVETTPISPITSINNANINNGNILNSNQPYSTMVVLSNHNAMNIREHVKVLVDVPKRVKPPIATIRMKTQASVNKRVEIPVKSALYRPRPLIKLKKQVQIPSSQPLQIKTTNRPREKAPSIGRRKITTNNPISKLNSVPTYEENQHSALFSPETSDIFKRELNEFIVNRGTSTISTSSRRTKHNRRSPIKPDALAGPSLLNSCRQSGGIGRDSLKTRNNKWLPKHNSQWRLTPSERHLISGNTVVMFDTRKAITKGHKQQVLLQTRALNRATNFKWKT